MIKCSKCSKDKAHHRVFILHFESMGDRQYNYCDSCYDTLVRIIHMFNEGSPLYTGYVDDPTIVTSGVP